MTSTAIVHTQRPVSCIAKGKAWAANHRAQMVAKAATIDKLLLSQKWEEGELHELKQLLDGLEKRLCSPFMRDLCDATPATKGKLYDLRDELLKNV